MKLKSTLNEKLRKIKIRRKNKSKLVAGKI